MSNHHDLTKSLTSEWTHPLLGPLRSRIVMSAMTRDRAGPDHTATPEMAGYYGRRAQSDVGLILTEGTIVDATGNGYRSVPYISGHRHVESWRMVTAAVHAGGGRIFCQLWHCGRISHPDFLGGHDPVSSTDLQAAGISPRNGKPYGVPRRLRADELPDIVEMFRRGAANALAAGFDGVELHFGHGYLIDQFFDGRINDRKDGYGGSVEARCRFGLEIAEAVLQDCGVERVMVRISPSRFLGEPYEWLELDEMLEYLIPAFDAVGLRLLDISCARADYFATSGRVIRTIRPRWPHLLIGGASLSPEHAQAELDSGLLDMVTYGRLLIANPDLVLRIRRNEGLRPYDSAMLERLD